MLKWDKEIWDKARHPLMITASISNEDWRELNFAPGGVSYVYGRDNDGR